MKEILVEITQPMTAIAMVDGETVGSSKIVINLVQVDDKTKACLIFTDFLQANTAVGLIEKVLIKRPLTIDLLIDLAKQLNGKIEKAVVTEVKDSTYYALIYLELNGQTLTIDCRPSDAIILSLRTSCPLFVNEDLLQENQISEKSETSSQEDWFNNLDPDKLPKE